MKSYKWENTLTRTLALIRREKRRYKIESYRTSDGWAYVSHPIKEEMTKEKFDALVANLPRCAQQARVKHGGRAKMVIPSSYLANELATFFKKQGNHVSVYKCDLSSPAIGKHWHLTSKTTK